MGPAIIGLLGVVVGAVITSGFQWFTSANTAKRRERAAARVLRDELWWWYAAAEQSLKRRHLLDMPDRSETFAAWKQYRSDLAGLSAGDWEVIQGALRRVELYDDDGMRNTHWTDAVADSLIATLRDIEEAVDALLLAGADNRRDRKQLKEELREGHWPNRRLQKADSK